MAKIRINSHPASPAMGIVTRILLGEVVTIEKLQAYYAENLGNSETLKQYVYNALHGEIASV